MTAPEFITLTDPIEEAPDATGRPSHILFPDVVICAATGVSIPPRYEADLL